MKILKIPRYQKHSLRTNEKRFSLTESFEKFKGVLRTLLVFPDHVK